MERTLPKRLIFGRKLANCKECSRRGLPPVLARGVQKNVSILFVGEAPGENEMIEGKPFVGKAGKFLNACLARFAAVPDDEKKGIEHVIAHAYYTNACICGTEPNRQPTAKEVDCCYSRLEAEIAAIKPKLIVPMGAVPTAKLLAFAKRKIVNVRGIYRVIDIKGRKYGVFPTLHPAYVLRGPEFYPDFMEDLYKSIKICLGDAPVIPPPYENYKTIKTQDDFEKLLHILEKKHGQTVALDLETQGDFLNGTIRCLGFSWRREHAVTLDWPRVMEGNYRNIRALSKVLSRCNCSFQNGGFDVLWLKVRGIKVKYAFDTMFAHFLLDERPGGHGLERLAVSRYNAPTYKSDFRREHGLGTFVEDEAKFAEKMAKVPDKDLFRYNAADTDYTFRLTEDLLPELVEDKVDHLLYQIMIPAALLYADLNRDGMLVDREYLEDVGKKHKAEMDRLEAEMKECPEAETVNIRSSKQVAKYLYDTLKLKPFHREDEESYGEDTDKIDEEIISECIRTVEDPEAREYWQSKRTQMSEGMKGMGGVSKGMSKRSTSTYMLYWLRLQNEFAGLLIKWKAAQKRYGTYYKGTKKWMWKDGRVRPEYNITGIRTARFKTRHPAIHNLPRGDEIYNIYIADPGWVLIHTDYSAIDMRIMAHMSKDKRLILLLDDRDIHIETAKMLFHLTDDDVKKLQSTKKGKEKLTDMRIAAKMVNFGIPYGRSAAGLAPQLGITKEEGEAFTKRFFGRMPQLKRWMDHQKIVGIRNHVIVSLYGYKRRFPFVADRHHKREVERQCVNAPIQNATSYTTFLAQLHTVQKLREMRIPVRIWPHIHDSFSISVPQWAQKTAVKVVADCMHDIPFKSPVKFPCVIEVGTRWGDMKEVYKG